MQLSPYYKIELHGWGCALISDTNLETVYICCNCMQYRTDHNRSINNQLPTFLLSQRRLIIWGKNFKSDYNLRLSISAIKDYIKIANNWTVIPYILIRLAIVFKKQVFCREYTCSHLYLIKIAQLYCPFAIPSSITIILFPSWS